MTNFLNTQRVRLHAWLLLVLGLFIAAKVLFLLKYHLPVWDEAVYLGMGKYIYSLGHSGLWETIRPPGLPFLVGALWKLRLPYVFFSEIIMMLFGIGSILLSYLIANKLFNRKVAVLAAALLATSPWFYLYSSYILTEIPSAFFALLALYAFISRRYSLSGAAAATAMLFKFPNSLVLAVIAAAVIASAAIKNGQLLKFGNFGQLAKAVWQKSQLLPLVKVVLAFVFVTLPFFVFNYLFYRPFTGNAFDAVFRPIILGAWHQSNPSKAIASQLYNYSFYLVEAFRQHFVFIFFLAAAVLFWKRRWFADRGKLLLAIFLLVYLAYFSYIPNKDERFLILFLPAICLFTAAAFFEVVGYFKDSSRFTGSLKPVRTFILVAAVSLLVLSFAVAAYKDYHFYSWRPASEPAVVSDLYKSLPGLNVTGAILTSEPFFSVYSDNLFIYYYLISFEGTPQELKALNEWEQNKTFQGIIYSSYPNTLFCPHSDSECKEANANLYGYLESRFKPLRNRTYYDGAISYTVFVNESYQNKQNSG